MEAPLSERYQRVRDGLAEACRAAGRSPADVTLLAVSKRHPDEAVRALAALGQVDFGENQVQAFEARRAALSDLPLRWHLIGPLQTNKARHVAAAPPHLLHTVDRPALVEALARRWERPAPLDVLIQVDIDREAQKSGCAPEALDALADLVSATPALRLRGLMCIPRPATVASPRAAFARTRAALEAIRDRVDLTAGAPVLSMGMSDDYPDAIAEGSTLVRVGTAIFGARD
ncbi:MAG: YggS family pyridoxal phosphate-dependent enzyme [Deltaproteobacteria bacterium]|nr:YggS family pyridoxal phosphate-dependent enzyme [Deltaproteobacteria bacterium]MCB9786456.1 YggS family pyridoxal phosphate-dependent enzyme [Deltaproteobacteria bacterium]